jgi:IclR family pca regulon transcriptional regulator
MGIMEKSIQKLKKEKKSIYHVGSLERGLSVLEFMASERRPVRLLEIVEKLNINYTSATRMCTTLNELGFINKDGMKRYTLTTKVLTLGYAVLCQKTWIELVKSILQQLFDQINQTVNMGIFDDDSVLYLCRLRKDKYLPFDIQVGSKLPLHCTALGKALLAFSRPETIKNVLDKLDLKKMGPKTITEVEVLKKQLKIIKQIGYSISDEELTPNVIAVGCPILDSQGFALMAINVTVTKNEFTKEMLIKSITPKLLSTAKEITKLLDDMKINQKEILQSF